DHDGPRVRGIECAEQGDLQRAEPGPRPPELPPRISSSHRRAYFVKTENAASMQSTIPALPSRNPPSSTYIRRNRSHGRKRSRDAEARTPFFFRSSADHAV